MEDSYEHPQTTKLLGELARSFGVKVGSADERYWLSSLAVAKAFDQLVDDDGKRDIEPEMNMVLGGRCIPRLSSEQATRFAGVYHNLDPERQERFVAACQLGAFAMRRYQATDVDEYIDVTQRESALFAGIMMIDEDQDDRAARRDFNQWLYAFARAGYSLDTLSDLAADYKESLTQIKPSLAAYRRLASVACRDVVACIQQAPKKVVPILTLGIIGKGLRKVKGLRGYK